MAWQIAAIWTITGIATFDFVRSEIEARRARTSVEIEDAPAAPDPDAARRRRLRSIGF